MGYTQLQHDGLVTVLIRQGEDGISEVEIFDGRMSPNIELLHSDTIYCGYVNGGDSLNEDHLYRNRVGSYYPDQD